MPGPGLSPQMQFSRIQLLLDMPACLSDTSKVTRHRVFPGSLYVSSAHSRLYLIGGQRHPSAAVPAAWKSSGTFLSLPPHIWLYRESRFVSYLQSVARAVSLLIPSAVATLVQTFCLPYRGCLLTVLLASDLAPSRLFST